MARVFISHTLDSRDYARNLVVALRSMGDTPNFVDQDARSGQSISQSIRASLKQSDYLVVLLTDRALKNPWVMFEIGAAEGLGKRVIAILLANVDADELDYIQRDRWVLDARQLSPTQTAQRIKSLTQELL